MPSGRRKRRAPIIAPEGYLTVAEAAPRLGMTESGVRKLLQSGGVPSIPGPPRARGFIRFVPLSAVESYQPRRRGRPPGTPDAKPRQAIHRVAPPRSRHPRQTASASNGDGTLAPPRHVQTPGRTPAPALSPDTLWETLAALEQQKAQLWRQIRTGVSDDLRDAYFLLMKRMLHTEETLLDQLYIEAEPAQEKPDTIDYFGGDGEEVPDGRD